MQLDSSILGTFAQDCRTRGMSEISIKSYVWRVGTFQKFLGRDKDASQADKLDIRSYIDACRTKGLTTATVQCRLVALAAFYEWLVFEEKIKKNPILEVRRRYLQRYKSDGECQTHKVISVDEAAELVKALVDIRDKAIVMLLLKTGIRRGELISLDVDSVNWKEQSLTLESTKKRTNRIVFFDDEAAHYLRRWLAIREGRDGGELPALFLSTRGERLKRGGIDAMIRKAAIHIGLHDTNSKRMEDHFSPHCTRHWFTTQLRKAGMPREFIQELRGDIRREAIDIYDHIDKDELKKSYLVHIPQLGV